MKTEIARVNIPANSNRMKIARAFANHPAFHLYRIGEIVETMRSYERDGLLVITDCEAVLYHIF